MEGEITILGEWKGTYYYNIPEEFPDIKVNHVEFVIKINTVRGSEFNGTVVDNTKMGGTPGVGKIKGWYTDTHLYFEKLMPVYGYIKKKW